MTPEELPEPQRRALAAGLPYRAHVIVTHTCNLACQHCYQAEHRSDDLSLEELTRVFHEMAGLGTLFLTLGGGEPLARRDFWEVLAAARKERFAVDLFTNGTLVDGEAARRLKQLGVVRVAVSLHGGHAQTHDAFVQRPGTFDRIQRAIDHLTAAGLATEVKTNVTTTNHRELPDIEARLGGRPLVQLKHAFHLHAKDDGDAAPTRLRVDEGQERAATRDELAGWTAERIGKTFEQAARAQARSSEELAPCQAARTAFALMPNGDVTPCTVTGGLVMGNVRQRPLAEIWGKSAMGRRFRAISHGSFEGERDECASCDFRKVCGRCPALASEASGSLTGYSAQVCQSTKVRWTELRRRALELGLSCPV